VITDLIVLQRRAPLIEHGAASPRSPIQGADVFPGEDCLHTRHGKRGGHVQGQERAGSDGCAYRHGVEHAGEMMVSRIVCLTGDLERTLDSGKGMAYSWCFDFCMDGHGVPSVVTGGQMTVVNAWTMQRLASSSLKPFSDCNTAEASV